MPLWYRKIIFSEPKFFGQMLRKMLYDILEKLNKKGLTIVIISHDERGF